MGYLYHYTSCEGLFGMLQDYDRISNPNLTMWATNALFMNDSSEFFLGREINEEALLIYEKEHKIASDDVIGDTLGSLVEPKLRIESAPFVISLSENISNAAMWSLYSNRGKGIALKIDKAKLTADLRTHLRPCIYCNSATEFLQQNYQDFDGLYKSHKQLARLDKHHQSETNKEFGARFLSVWFAPQIKHKSFSYEREMRFIYHISFEEYPKIKFRCNKDFIVPYVEIKVPISALCGIVIGPTANHELVHRSLGLYLSNKGVEFQRIVDNIQQSEVPYRG